MEHKCTLKIPDDFSLEKFAETYVEEAIKAAKEFTKYDSYRNQVAVSVAWRLGISPEVVSYLENPFHWEFFCDNKDGSLFKYIQVTHNNGQGPAGSYVGLRREPNGSDARYIAQVVLNGYEDPRRRNSQLYFKSSNQDSPVEIHSRRELFDSKLANLKSSQNGNGHLGNDPFREWLKTVGCLK